MTRMLATWLICVSMSGWCMPAAAMAYCHCYADDLSDFGTAALGDPISKLPLGVTRDSSCQNYIPGGLCEFYDKTGVGYVVWRDKIIRKEVRTDAPVANPSFPFGLSAKDTIADVLTKLGAYASDIAFLPIHAEVVGGRISIKSDRPLAPDNGAEFQIIFNFGQDDLLQSVVARMLSRKSR